MRHKKYFSLAFISIFLLISSSAWAEKNTGQDNEKSNSANQSERHNSNHSAKTHSLLAEEHKAGHAKVHAPHSEELPHIHKFHKERIKKIRRHKSKYWFLSQVLLFICHAAVLYIGYLHALH